ncbi:hypothetical protein NDU88_002454 [Pleurodeles waltl]|uniref:Putative nucleotidyltransferase MAB21L1 n=2 Tax=Pleurodeles waltl TaxID=8319 RepID=A0AAV7NN68_PLEWA|nr:hypothetical protein NDU88_002454 [Pleurodeles waltl]
MGVHEGEASAVHEDAWSARASTSYKERSAGSLLRAEGETARGRNVRAHTRCLESGHAEGSRARRRSFSGSGLKRDLRFPDPGEADPRCHFGTASTPRGITFLVARHTVDLFWRFQTGLAPASAAALDPTAYCETPVYNPDLCPNMIAAQAKLVYHLNKYYNEKCQARKAAIAKTIREVCKVVSDVLKEVEVQEPRFISSLNEMDNRYEGLEVVSPTEFEVVLYLNQMGVFNFVDDGSLPGCAVLKLSDGRKRSMSLWVEFITASGYLSARKIRSRFQTLVAQAVDKCSYRDVVKMVADTSEVRLRIRDRYVVQITPAFKCTGIWPRSAAHWPLPHIPWPGPNRVAEVKAEGFNLLSKECHSLSGKQSSAESDAWVLQFAEAENRLQMGGCRKKCLSVLKTLRDRHLELPGQPLNNYHMKTLVSYECEKHPRESDWDESCLGDRLNGILLQLISCLQCRRCPHYFLPNLDLFQGKPHSALENAAKQTWRLAREILTNPKSLEKL